MAKAGNHGIVIPRNRALLSWLYWDCGWTLPEIGRLYDVTHKSVERVMRALGVPRRPVNARPPRVCGCGAQIKKVRHAGNGSLYGRECADCRRLHRNKLARDYAERRPDVREKRRDYMRRWYESGAINPQGEDQWITKSRHLLRSTRRLLATGQIPVASPSRKRASTPARSSPA